MPNPKDSRRYLLKGLRVLVTKVAYLFISVVSPSLLRSVYAVVPLPRAGLPIPYAANPPYSNVSFGAPRRRVSLTAATRRSGSFIFLKGL
jgi:hypothetical protein